MTRSSMVGLAVAAVVLGVAIVLMGRNSIFVHLPSLAIVLGGTLVGTLIAYPPSALWRLYKNIIRLFTTRQRDPRNLVELFVTMWRVEKRYGPRAMEIAAEKVNIPFLNMGVAMISDGKSAVEIRGALEREMDFYLAQREGQRSILTTMARLAPALGLAGTVVGMIRMLSSITDPSQVSLGLSTALLTTFYGLILANLFIVPLSRKMLDHIRHETMILAMIMEGVLALRTGEHAVDIAGRLKNCFISDRPLDTAYKSTGAPLAEAESRRGLRLAFFRKAPQAAMTQAVPVSSLANEISPRLSRMK